VTAAVPLMHILSISIVSEARKDKQVKKAYA